PSNAGDLAERRIAWEDLWTRVEEVSLLCVKAVVEPAHKDTVVLVKGVVDAAHEMRPGEFGRRIPEERSDVEPVAAGGKAVRQGQFVDQAVGSRVSSDAARVVREYVVAVHAI